MQAANQSIAPSETSRANGQIHPHELFMLTDEQILEIEPEAQDVEVAEVAPASLPASPSQAQNSRLEAGATWSADVQTGRGANGETLDRLSAQTQSSKTHGAQAGVPVLLEPPGWLAETMNDPQRGAEARALWDGAQRAEKEAASYREVFARPEEARAAAERARVLDDIDRAYFAGDSTQRAQLAAMMIRQDPAAFREMVFEGLRALESTGQAGKMRGVSSAVGATLGSPTTLANGAQPAGASPAPTTQSNNQEQFEVYASFERAANDELERSVGDAIERTLEQALPAAGRSDAAGLKIRMAAAIRQDVEKALQGDRQLGEQVAQILSGKRLDSETRAQVVRLIGERARQLVPGATKRALSDWTQTTLAAHRGRRAVADAAPARREVAPAAPEPRTLPVAASKQKEASRPARPADSAGSKGRVNYGKLSDEQILDL